MKKGFLLLAFLLGMAASCFADGLVLSQKGEKYGYTDASGNVVIKHSYTYAFPFKDGLAKVKKGDKWGFINEDGKPVIKIQYKDLSDFENGRARVQTKKGKYGYIDRAGDFVIPAEYDFIGTYNDAGYVWVAKGSSLNTAWKGLYKDSRMILPCSYLFISFFTDEMVSWKNALYACNNNQQAENLSKLPLTNVPYIMIAPERLKSGLADLDGHVIVKPINYAIGVPGDGFAHIAAWYTNGKYAYNYISTDGNNRKLFSSDLTFENPEKKSYRCTPFEGGVAKVSVPGQSYLINATGSTISQVYDELTQVGTKGYIAKKGDKWGLVSVYGSEITPLEYDAMVTPKQGCELIGARNATGKSGYIDMTGSAVIPFEYEAVSYSLGDYAICKKGGKWGVVDMANKPVLDYKWDRVFSSVPGKLENGNLHVWVKEADSQKWRDHLLNAAAPQNDLKFDNVWHPDQDGFVKVQQGDYYGIYSLEDGLLVPALFTEKQYSEAREEYKNGHKKRWEPIDALRFQIKRNPKKDTYKLSQTVPDDLWDY